jgi:acetamidase/formamidase
MESFHLSSDRRHLAWDRDIAPAVTVAPGDEVVLELVDASGGQIRRDDDAGALSRLDFNALNPCTGPVFVEGVGPGDDLVVTIEEIATSEWSWTANIPGFGLLSDDFPDPHLWISSVHDGLVSTPVGLDVPARPMIGTIGVAPSKPGPAPLLVPTLAGGNMDIAQLGVGTTLHLASQVSGGLLSAGDTHARQGDGEVCGTGAETSATVRLRIERGEKARSSSPWFHFAQPDRASSWVGTTGIGPDLFLAARDATRRAVELVSSCLRIAEIDAYLLLSLVGVLTVSEIVDAPNWVMSMHVPGQYAGL